MKDYKEELASHIPQDMEYERLTLSNDFIFGKVMQNKELCVELIRILTGNEVDGNVTINNQENVKVTSDSKGVRYDIYVEDDKYAYDTEMQNDDSNKDLSKRTRFYQGIMDVKLLEKGAHYKTLKNSYVIFICTYDPFKKGYICYEFENLCRKDETIELNDGRKILIFNTKGTYNKESQEVDDFLHYVETGNITNTFTEKLDNEVRKARKNKEWRMEYMKTWVREMDIREEGREEGREYVLTTMIAKKIKKGKTLDEIAYDIEMEASEIEDLYNMIVREENKYQV